jgi:hypothetical protein
MRTLYLIVALILIALGCGRAEKGEPTPAAEHGGRTVELNASDTYHDGDLLISVDSVIKSQQAANTTELLLSIKNQGAGKIYHVPAWYDRASRDVANIVDEHGNRFRAYSNLNLLDRYPRMVNEGGKYVTKSPAPIGDRVDPGADDMVRLDFSYIPATSKDLRIELPYGKSILAFNHVPYSG